MHVRNSGERVRVGAGDQVNNKLKAGITVVQAEGSSKRDGREEVDKRLWLVQEYL